MPRDSVRRVFIEISRFSREMRVHSRHRTKARGSADKPYCLGNHQTCQLSWQTLARSTARPHRQVLFLSNKACPATKVCRKVFPSNRFRTPSPALNIVLPLVHWLRMISSCSIRCGSDDAVGGVLSSGISIVFRLRRQTTRYLYTDINEVAAHLRLWRQLRQGSLM